MNPVIKSKRVLKMGISKNCTINHLNPFPLQKRIDSAVFRAALKSTFLFGVIILLASGCYYDSFEALHPLDGYVDPCDTTLKSTYASSIKLIIAYNCIACHNSTYSGGNVNLGAYDQVKQYSINGKLINSILRNSGYNPMPPTQALATCQTQRIQQWIANNYPQ